MGELYAGMMCSGVFLIEEIAELTESFDDKKAPAQGHWGRA
jgi:hypothetical protein